MYTTLHTVMFEVKHHAISRLGYAQPAQEQCIGDIGNEELRAVGREGAAKPKSTSLDDVSPAVFQWA
jgi:hypothetical protein